MVAVSMRLKRQLAVLVVGLLILAEARWMLLAAAAKWSAMRRRPCVRLCRVRRCTLRLAAHKRLLLFLR